MDAKVVDAKTGNGLEGANLELLEGSTSKPIILSSTTGQFNFGEVRPGTYKLGAHKPGYTRTPTVGIATHGILLICLPV